MKQKHYALVALFLFITVVVFSRNWNSDTENYVNPPMSEPIVIETSTSPPTEQPETSTSPPREQADTSTSLPSRETSETSTLPTPPRLQTETEISTSPPRQQDQFSFITSSYYFPTSSSLGDNALALVMTMNLLWTWAENQTIWDDTDESYMRRFRTDEVVIYAENATDDVTVTAKMKKVTVNSGCRMSTVFASAQLIPNVQRIWLLSGEDKTLIPFSTPQRSKRDVVFCISPLFISENWQNIMFAVHIYKHYGAHVHLYLSSAEISLFKLLLEYEANDYITLQKWLPIDFPGVTKKELDWVTEVEFRNQAAAQTDCLIQYKDKASFVSFLDLDDILIPKVAPTYIEEFQKLMHDNEIIYLYYYKQNYKVNMVNDISKYSFTGILGSLTYQDRKETGKSVFRPNDLNTTWIHNPSVIPDGKRRYEVVENSITHLKEIEMIPKTVKNLTMPVYMNTSDFLMSEKDAVEIEKDFERMIQLVPVSGLLGHLPKEQYYGDIIRKCYYDIWYKLYDHGQSDKVTCTGPARCEYKQHPDIKCVHVNATYQPMPRLYPITYYYSTDSYFTKHMGCYP